MHVRTHSPKVTTNLPLLIKLPFGLEKQRQQHELCTCTFGAKKTLVPLFSHGEQRWFFFGKEQKSYLGVVSFIDRENIRQD